eukprot:TRINITY_DN8985_c0_g3_i1.p1 TRINITY_DN8985_c0_g3~~TRINITY_DN8985_c0_g3_i1.p1  ORF type:complete len:235 (+),score=43.06 TRINITY_DN8985_c0_g3_i1:35-706(+)
MDVQSPVTVQCKLQRICGQPLLVEAPSSWTILKLREHIASTLGIPEYEQVFAQEGVLLHNNMVLRALPWSGPGACLELSFGRSFKPACLSEEEADYMWQAFLLHSRDHGLAVDGAHASKIARFAGLFEVARMIKRQAEVPASFTFAEVLHYVAELQETLPPRPAPMPEDDWLFDIGRSPLLPEQARLLLEPELLPGGEFDYGEPSDESEIDGSEDDDDDDDDF